MPQSRIREHSGRLNALRRHRGPDDPAVQRAEVDLVQARAEDYIRRLVESAPALTPEARARLAVLLRGAAV